MVNWVSQMQITTQDITRLCHEICDIKEEQINKLPSTLSKVPNNIPDQWDICDKHALGYAKNTYNKLCPSPPSDSHDSPARRDSSPPPTPSPSAQMPPGPPPFCQGGPRRSPEMQSTLVWSSCWGATGSAGCSTQRGEQRRVVRTRGNKGEVGVTRDQCRVW